MDIEPLKGLVAHVEVWSSSLPQSKWLLLKRDGVLQIDLESLSKCSVPETNMVAETLQFPSGPWVRLTVNSASHM